MTPTALFAICLVSFWALLSLLSHLLTKFAPQWSQKLSEWRIILSYTSLVIETDVFTPWVVWLATRWRKWVHFWFLFGAYVCVACFALTLTYLLPAYIYRTFFPSGVSTSVEVQVIIPGVTVPWEYVPHMMIAIFLTLAFHELGHALSGANDNKAIESFGVGVQLFVPVAYVRFRENHYDLTPWRQLKVYCAGAWHNFVLYLIAYLVIAHSSKIFGVAYERHEKGQVVASIRFHTDYSPLKIGDTIVGLNQHTIRTLDDWNKALQEVILQQSLDSAVCVPPSWIPSNDAKEDVECCAEDYEGAIPCWREAKIGGAKFCKPAKEVWASGVTFCKNDSELEIPTCGEKQMKCAVPSLQQKYTQYGLKLMQIRVLRGSEKEVLLHVRQHPAELQQQVLMELYVPRWTWMPTWTRRWADNALVVCELLTSFNFITPIVSLLPIIAFDGEYVLYALTVWLLPKWDEEARETFIAWIRNITTGVGVVIGLCSMYKALM